MQSDSASVKAHIRSTSQKLGQMQAKNDSQATITCADIATLIQRGNISLAREKAEKLILDEAFGDLVGELEMQLGILLERFNEFDRNVPPSPVMIEATSTIIYSTPFIRSKDLDVIRKYLIQRVGPDFTLSAAGNRDNHVSTRAIQAISTPIPSAFRLDEYLQNIADAFGVSWSPEPSPQNILNSLSELLDLEVDHEIDLSRLRTLCLQGIPDEPAWLRPRIWRLFFGVLPTQTSKWKEEVSKQRTAYYDLVRRLLAPFVHSSSAHSLLDDNLLDVYKHLSGLPRDIYSLLEDEPERPEKSPFDDDAPENIRIPFANVLESRLSFLQDQDKERSVIQETPEIRLEADASAIPPTTLLSWRQSLFGNAHPNHCSSLLRILYLHNAINPGNSSYHTPSVLVPLYSVLMQEIEVDDLTHAEADIFWLLEAVVAEFSGLEDEDGIASIKSFKERVKWADPDLQADLEVQGLDPGLPHYSYRWLMPLLAHTLPLPSLLLAWDALFSRPARTKGSSPKLDYLVLICTSMLLRAKNHLHKLSSIGQNNNNLWTAGLNYRQQPIDTPTRSQDSFLELLSFLQKYNLDYVGGISRVLQTAQDLHHRLEQETSSSQQASLSLGARLNMWRNFGSQLSSNNESNEEIRKEKDQYAESDDTEVSGTPYRSSFASQLSNTVWRGITNQSAMEDEYPSTPTPPSPSPTPTPPDTHELDAHSGLSKTLASSSGSSIWNYAGKFKESDTVAKLSKVSTNWGARMSMLGSWNAPTPLSSAASEPTPSVNNSPVLAGRRGSLPVVESTNIKYPSSKFLSPQSATFQDSPLSGGSNSEGLLGKTRSLLSIARAPHPTTPKSAPRPLFLNSSTLITTTGQRHPRSASDSIDSTRDVGEWADVMRTKRNHFQRDSQSSVSSRSPSDAFRAPSSTKSDYESDTGTSRKVPLNRRSVSPMAPNFRINQEVRPPSRNSSSSGIHSPPMTRSPLQESSVIDGLPKILQHGIESRSSHSLSSVASTISHLGSKDGWKNDDSDTTSNEIRKIIPKPLRRSSEPQVHSEDTPDPVNTSVVPTKIPRVRSKKYPRPENLQIQDNRPKSSTDLKASSPSNLTVDWPGDDYENATTPRASNFDSNELPSRSPRRSRKLSAGDVERLRKSSTDTVVDERPRKISSGHRSRKISTGSREVQKRQRESEAEEGDDEGYDELLSAYESEDGPMNSSLR